MNILSIHILTKRNTFLKKYRFLEESYEKIEKLNDLRMTQEIKLVVQHLPLKEIPCQMVSLANSIENSSRRLLIVFKPF